MSQRGVLLGRHCEDEAVRFLKRMGYKIIERNYRSRFGEIDAIAIDRGSLVFVEIKSRSSPLFGPPQLRITKKKRHNIIKTALSYLKRHSSVDAYCRIDVVAISLDKNKDRIELIKDAFGATGRYI
ncbi:MAG: YraN family protein [Candidatus Omnitrophota bacterium]